MCELYCFSGTKERFLNPELKILFSHSETNPNGWGLFAQSKGEYLFEKGPEPAHESKKLAELLERPIYGSLAMGHIRHASIGANAYLNSHPFQTQGASGRTWTFMHNGSIFEGPVLDKYKEIQTGKTDSERILFYMVDRTNQAAENHELTDKEQFEILEEIVEELSPENKLNLIVTNGEWVAIHTNMEHTLYEKKEDDGQVISTVPLSDDGWSELPLNTLIVYKDGEQIYTGKPHTHTYIEDEERLQALLDVWEEEQKREDAAAKSC